MFRGPKGRKFKSHSCQLLFLPFYSTPLVSSGTIGIVFIRFLSVGIELLLLAINVSSKAELTCIP